MLARRTLAVTAALALALGAQPGIARQPEPTEIHVGVRPFTSPAARWITVRADGVVSAIEYEPNRLVVTGVRRSQRPRTDIDAVLASARHPDIRSALDHNFAGGGLSRGDQFEIAVVGPQGAATITGFLDEAPVAVKALIDAVHALDAGMQRVTPSYGYARSTNIAPPRLASLRKAATMRLLPLGKVPEVWQHVARLLVRQPRTFIAVDSEQYRSMAAAATPNGLAVLDGTNAVQVELYVTQEK